MANPVVIGDYIDRYGQPENPDEVEAMLDDAWEVLIHALPSVEAKVESGKISHRLIVKIITGAVHRHLLNPKGFVSETTGPFSYRLNDDASTGDIWFTDRELWLLGKRSKVGNIQLTTRWPKW